METKIFELLLNGTGLAIALSILFYYSLNSFKTWKLEREELRKELHELQNNFHLFKNEMIKELFQITDKSTACIEKFSVFLEKNKR